MIRVQYIDHSGFLVEMERVYLLFDFDKGELPKLNQDKKLFVFVSHKHPDHYNRDIWKLKNLYLDTHFVLSKDVPFSAKQRVLLGISEEDCSKVTRVCAKEQYCLEGREGQTVRIAALKSTDIGVAYLVYCEGYLIYHAGDLNRWVWKEESEQWNQDMAEKYSQQLEELQQILGGEQISIAFLPVDPRQKEEAFGGICEFLKKISVKTVFPMHLWGKYEWIERCIQVVASSVSEAEAKKIVLITKKGQEWA